MVRNFVRKFLFSHCQPEQVGSSGNTLDLDGARFESRLTRKICQLGFSLFLSVPRDECQHSQQASSINSMLAQTSAQSFFEQWMRLYMYVVK
jgi:hypothetical protein